MTERTVTDAMSSPYRVLARKYRPTTFADLIGQEAMVRVLTNAFLLDRVPHAFILTGVRGVGKTTTARIIARALNCVGSDGTGGPTPSPCGVCDPCVAIAQDRHVDVFEMDAATHTGIDDIRELIDGVRYRPVAARTKVYVIDEVHMLSRQAFNGLLKTLEEPPPHVVFVFATTEIRKVPLTVLSRCMRFDLHRVDQATLVQHFKCIAEREGVEASETALAIIARAADGSVRDGLSLLDQAIALGDGRVDEAHVKEMLGVADRTRVFDMFDALMRGDVVAALDILTELYNAGADPTVVFQDLLELTHWLTRIKVVPDVASAPDVPEAERVRGQEMAAKLSMSALSRTWQVLLKGLGEIEATASPLQAAEMVLIRLVYIGDLPSPRELVKLLGNDRPAGDGDGMGISTDGLGLDPGDARQSDPAGRRSSMSDCAAIPVGQTPEVSTDIGEGRGTCPELQSFEDVVGLAWEKREGVLAKHLSNDVHLVRFDPGRIEFRPTEHAPPDLAGRLARLLHEWTGHRWMVSVSGQEGVPILREQRRAQEERLQAQILQHPLVQAVMETFPGARLVDRRGPLQSALTSEASLPDRDTAQPDSAGMADTDTLISDDGDELS